ncbi:MAG: hypothetical protein JST26_00670 [Bacteroidetes bacterium]|nr:hypothetical protein [Bacteroidota bacterium]
MRIYCFIILWICACPVFSQSLSAFKEGTKWGFKNQSGIVIPAQYDSVMGFDAANRVCLVASKNAFNTVVNPLTGEEQADYDFYFINVQNRKIGILPEDFPDTVYTFKNQEELADNYLEHAPVFKILFNHKIYLISRQGKQLSKGFDNIYESTLRHFYITETYSEKNGQPLRIRGLIDSTGHVIASCRYRSIKINPEDSTVYCCSSASSGNLNDDIFELHGKLLYTNKRHIEYATRTRVVLKEYEPEEFYSFEDYDGKRLKTITGHGFYYLKHQKALVIQDEDWYILDMLTFKKTKVDKEQYFKNLVTLYYEPN